MFNSNNNKALLWSVLQNNNVFQGFKNDDFSHVHHEFEKQIQSYWNGEKSNMFKELTLIDQNKEFISSFRDFLSSYRISKINSVENKVPLFNNSSKTTINDDSKQKNIFEQRLREKQKEFEDLIKNPKPDTIDFSDNNEANDQVNNEDNKNLLAIKEEKQISDTNNIQSTLIKERNYENISENNTSNNINLNTNTNNQNNVPIELFNKLLQQMKIIEDKVEKHENTIQLLKQQIEGLETKNNENYSENKDNIMPNEESYVSLKR
jgi:hypothetical protein